MRTSTLVQKDQVDALDTLLSQSLGVRNDDEVLLVYDESFVPYMDAFVECVNNRDLLATYLYMPKSYQLGLAETISRKHEPIWFPNPLRSAISASSVILNVLDGELNTAPVRGAILAQQRSKDCRLAHIPGISDEILSIVLRTDFAKILADCELVSWFLGCGGKTVLTTFDASGREYDLSIELEGWSNEPLMSPGIIRPGSWGNVPPGEAFCCPDPGSVHGRVCINGSIPKHRLKDDEVILTFEKGKLVTWSKTPSDVTAFFDQQAQDAEKYGDRDWATFAELGIGLNPAIDQLTGNSLFDEKAAHTIHIAIGDNTVFGHAVKARIHADLVTLAPSLTVGGAPIITKGVLMTESLMRLRDGWVPPPAQMNDSDRIRLKDDEILAEEGLVYRRLYKSGRIGRVTMADEITSRALAALCNRLEMVDPYTIADLFEDHPHFNGVPTTKLLDILSYYNCLTVIRNGAL